MFIGHIGIYASNKDVIRRKSTLFFLKFQQIIKTAFFRIIAFNFV